MTGGFNARNVKKPLVNNVLSMANYLLQYRAHDEFRL